MFPSAFIVISHAINIFDVFFCRIGSIFKNKTRIEWRLDPLKVPIRELFHRWVQNHTETRRQCFLHYYSVAPQHY